MLSGSKSIYRAANPKHIVIFNANIVVKLNDGTFDKLWYGDLDITLDENAFRSIALDTECEIYVLREMDGRFEFEGDPQVDKYVFKTDGIEGNIPEDEFNKYVRNDEDQIIRA